MKVYIAKNILGFFVFSEEGDLLEFEPFPKDPKAISERLKKKTNAAILKKFKNFEIEDGGKILRRNFPEIIAKFDVSLPEYYSLLKGVAEELAKQELQSMEEDQLIIQGVKALDVIEYSLNQLTEMIREWYSLHFPELDKEINDNEKYSKLIRKYGPREMFEGELGKLAKESVGADFLEEDISIITDFSEGILSLWNFKKKLEKYIIKKMEKVAPNTSAIIGPTLGARLLHYAKGLDNLAKMPGSRLQLLGAERALFMHIRKKLPPPKHGIISQHPLIKSAPWWQRGKIARIIAQKISIAARADAFTGEYIADLLNKELNERIKEIKESYPVEPKKMRIIKRKKKTGRERKRR